MSSYNMIKILISDKKHVFQNRSRHWQLSGAKSNAMNGCVHLIHWLCAGTLLCLQ